MMSSEPSTYKSKAKEYLVDPNPKFGGKKLPSNREVLAFFYIKITIES